MLVFCIALFVLVDVSSFVSIRSNLLSLKCVSDKLKMNSSLRVKEASKHGGSDQITAQTLTFRELASATKNFRSECLLGEGGFGRVYKGYLESINQVSQLLNIASHYKGSREHGLNKLRVLYFSCDLIFWGFTVSYDGSYFCVCSRL